MEGVLSDSLEPASKKESDSSYGENTCLGDESWVMSFHSPSWGGCGSGL